MKYLKVILITMICVLLPLNHMAQSGSDDVLIPIVKYLSAGDINNLSAWFPEYLDVAIPASKSPVSKVQAVRILENFFDQTAPSELSISHTATKGKFKYAVGELVLNDIHYYITITLSLDGENSSYNIKQIKITR